MKKELTKEYVLSQRGCYNNDQVEAISCINKKKLTVVHIIKSEIPLKDKFWFVIRKCELTIRQKQDIAIGCAEIVLEIYESKYPNNKAPREAIQAAKDFLAGKITIDILRTKRDAAYDAAYDAYDAASYAAYAAYATATATAADADATVAYDAASYAAYAAAYAADAAYAASLKAIRNTTLKKDFIKLLLNFLLDFIKNN